MPEIESSELFRAQKVKIGMTTGARIDDGRKFTRKIISISPEVGKWKSKGDFQRDLGHSDNLAVAPNLAVNCNLTSGRNRIQERFAVGSKGRL
jgi:hypothetical protein